MHYYGKRKTESKIHSRIQEAKVQRLRERIPKKLASLGFGRRATPAQKTQVVQKLRQKHALDILLSIAQLPRSTFYYHLKGMKRADKYELEKGLPPAIHRHLALSAA